jgi:inner membrane protein YidH
MVDPRLLQANERTLLAWVRSSIALMTFGFVIARIGVWMRTIDARGEGFAGPELGTAWVGGLFVALGVVANAIAVVRYAAARRAIKHGREIPDGPFPTILAVLVTVFGTIIGAYLLRRLI